ncbi:hypothetical protein GCM10011611_48730 [Aliidongia dinghuensis]|uniref:T2SS protein K first SAM-like domain-containing protein n=1 Tax=Aliidongia dinghuensis TaxID=1867774 RepID=A0A8J2YXH1_9PROT|nr:type II secretion system protein GspK [Aliidongia dinghuensis]GGF36508.1 hypothetical protein GCM10011611_48730 [Aliidongia dinghuensis]
MVRRRAAAGRASGERGFALISVLAVLAILAVLVGGFALASRRSLELSRNAVAAATARARAEAGISLALAHLLDPDATQRWNADGRAHAVRFDGATITVTIQDEAGKIDLNWAPLELIAGLLAEVGVPTDAAQSILDAIDARRKAGTLPEAPPGDRAGAALLGGPRLRDLAGAPFRLVEELKSVPGVSQDLYDRLRPAVTVYSESRHIDPASAPRLVLLALPDMTPVSADAILAARPATGGQPRPDLPAAARAFIGGGDPRAVTITATVDHLTRRAVVSLTGRANQPYQILEWRQDFGS